MDVVAGLLVDVVDDVGCPCVGALSCRHLFHGWVWQQLLAWEGVGCEAGVVMRRRVCGCSGVEQNVVVCRKLGWCAGGRRQVRGAGGSAPVEPGGWV